MTEIIDAEFSEATETTTALAEGTPHAALAEAPSVSIQTLMDLGFIVPAIKPDDLRAAFATLQRMYAAILDPNDYMYSVSYEDKSGGRSRQKNALFTKREDAEKMAKLNGGSISAKPLKSGIVKLARALGIVATRKLVKGLPDEPTATYSYVVYEAYHERTGQREEGVGWCDKSERGGYISAHDVIATADTRAYNRAILRLSGFGDVSADEIVGTGANVDAPVVQAEPPKAQEFKALPPGDSDTVLTASRVWAEAVAKRDGERWAPEAKQDTRQAREFRARARRGDLDAARKLGGAGIRWDGSAMDGVGHTPFVVEAPPVTPESIQAASQSLQGALAEALASRPEKPRLGSNGSLDLTGDGSSPDEGLPPDLHKIGEAAAIAQMLSGKYGIPAPDSKSDVITQTQAKKVSTLLKQVFREVPEMKAWLRDECRVGSSMDIRANQYEKAKAVLEQMTKGGD